MSSRRRRRRPFPFRALALVFVVAIISGWALDRAMQHRAARNGHARHRHPVVAALPSTPAATPELTLAPAGSPPSTVPSAAPAATALKTQPPEAPSPAVPTTALTANPAANSGGRRLAIIIDDCGQWIDTERALVALPIPLTVSILPSVPYTGTIEREASAAGKGIMLHLPMEPMAHLDPGPGKITVDMTDAEVEARVRADLAQLPLARGVNNHEGSRATSDPRIMRDVIGVLAAEDRFFIDSKTSPASVGEQLAASAGIPTAGRDVFLDNQADVAATEAQLRAAAAIARRDGSAIAIGHPRPTTLAALREEIPQLQSEGIDFVLAQDLVVRHGTDSPERSPEPQRSAAESGL